MSETAKIKKKQKAAKEITQEQTVAEEIKREKKQAKEEMQKLMGKRLRMAREGTLKTTKDGKIIKHKETQEYLALHLELEYNRELINRWENGKIAIPHYVIVQLADHYKKDVNYFYGLDS